MRTRLVDVALGAFLVVGCAIAAWTFRQADYWSDGRSLVELLGGGSWNYHNLLYLPTGHLLEALLRPFGTSTRTVLEILSVAATGLALAFTFAAARVQGIGRAAALCGTAVLAAAPTVWFYATCVEVHPLQLAASAGALLWFVRSADRGSLGRSALAPAFFFCILQSTHVSGVLCVPALFLLAFRGTGRWAWPRHVLLGLLVVALFAGLWYGLQGAQGPAQRYAGQALRDLGTGWRPDFLWHELVVETGMLYPMAFALLAVTWRRDVQAVLRPLPLALLVLVATFVPFALTFLVEERGAYYFWAVPALGLCACRLLELMGSWKLPLAAALLGLHVYWGSEQIRAWTEDYPGHEWVPTLEEEAGSGALVLTLYSHEWVAVQNHSGLEAVRPSDEALSVPERWAAALVKAVQIARAGNRKVVIMRSLYELDYPSFDQAVEELVRRFGAPRPGRRPEYLVFE